jgi:hypothetical protein
MKQRGNRHRSALGSLPPPPLLAAIRYPQTQGAVTPSPTPHAPREGVPWLHQVNVKPAHNPSGRGQCHQRSMGRLLQQGVWNGPAHLVEPPRLGADPLFRGWGLRKFMEDSVSSKALSPRQCNPGERGLLTRTQHPCQRVPALPSPFSPFSSFSQGKP